MQNTQFRGNNGQLLTFNYKEAINKERNIFGVSSKTGTETSQFINSLCTTYGDVLCNKNTPTNPTPKKNK